MDEGQGAPEAVRGELVSTAIALHGNEAAEICGALLDSAASVLAELQGSTRKAAWAACVLAGRLGSGSQRPARLSDVLRACDLTLETAVRELSPAAAALDAAVAAVLGGGVPLERRLKLRELKQSFVFNTLLAKKTRDLYAAHFSLPADPSPRAPLGFSWLLFNAARAALLPPSTDLVTRFALLLACTHLLLRHVPRQALRQGKAPPVEAATQQAAAEGLLLDVAVTHGAAEHAASVRHLAGMLQQLLTWLLQPHLAPEPLAGGQQDAASSGPSAASEPAWVSFPGLFAPDGLALPAAVHALQQHHGQLTLEEDVDAVPFLTPPQAAGQGGAANAATQRAAAAEERDTAAAKHGAAASQAALREGERRQEAVEGAAGEAVQAAAATAAIKEDPRSPEGRAMSRPVAVTPKRPRVAPSHAADRQEGTAGGRAGEAPAWPDAAYRTPSPARMASSAPHPNPTPISCAMTSTGWLQAFTAGQPEGPPEELQALLRQAGIDEEATARLSASARRMVEAAFPDCAAALQAPLAALERSTTAARRGQAVRLYWRAVAGMAAAEAARPDGGAAAAAAVLSAPLFHRCVAACAFECVAFAYQMGSLSFPAVLERLHLPAFDLCKVVEPFVLQLPGMPRDLKRHMLSVEERCLESLAWQPGSSLFAALAAAVGGCEAAAADVGMQAPREPGPLPGNGPGVPEQQQQHQHEQQQPNEPTGGGLSGTASLDGESSVERRAVVALTPSKRPREGAEAPATPATDADMADAAEESPCTEAAADTAALLPGVPLAFGGAGQPGGRGDSSARKVVKNFLQRVLKLGAIRLADLLSRVGAAPADPQQLLAEAFTLTHYVVHEHTWLLYGRHLDQILLCCLYSVLKLRQLAQASFKAIVAAYREQPQAHADVFKSISMRRREASGGRQPGPAPAADIITFYNQIFIPHTRPFLLRVTETAGLLVQPPACALLCLQPTAGRGLGMPSPPALHARAPHPASFQTPSLPAAAGWGPGWPSPLAAVGKPSCGGGGMLLLSPGAWRITRSGTTPLASPQTDRLAALRVAGSPAPPPSLAPAPLASVADAAAAGLPSVKAHPSTQLSPRPDLLVPVAAPTVPSAAAKAAANGASAGAVEAAAKTQAAAGLGTDGSAGQRVRQQPQAQRASRLDELPQESLPLLAAAAEAAEEIERQEQWLAAATAALVAGAPPPSALQPQHAPPLPLPVLQQPLLNPRRARRVLALQPASLP